NPIHEVTADRTIPMPMLKSTNLGVVDAEVDKEDKTWVLLRNSLYRMFLNHFDEVRKIKNERIDLPHISSRERNQIWKPIIILARLFEIHGVEGLVDSVLRVVEDTHNMRTVTNQSSNTDIQILEILCEDLDIKILPIGNKEGEIHWFGQQSILNVIRKISGLEYLSSKELGNILGRLGFERRKKNPHGLCTFISDELLKGLCEKYNLDFQALTAHKSHLAQPNDKSA
ncbi:MAG: hypothetical protein KGL95_10485, partial [Patescibacteria group bacterium]|nr:hypothetical protein [Patescibacteria group bacterium]